MAVGLWTFATLTSLALTLAGSAPGPAVAPAGVVAPEAAG
jgi:hypothetical protein